MNMCYGRHTGYGGYGEWARGGRQILLDQRSPEEGVQTWIRMEDETISGAVYLNATYGHDRYGLSEKINTSGQSGNLSRDLDILYFWMFVLLCLMSGVH